jgi:formylglycine-generating enzyme required for sulfatase activity
MVLGVLPATAPFGRLRAAEPEIVTNSIGMQLVFIPAGEFEMGTPKSETGDLAYSELPLHHVRITEPFYLGRYEVTLGEFMEFRRETKYTITAETARVRNTTAVQDDPALTIAIPADAVPWNWGHPDQTLRHPVVMVSPKDAEAFCRWLSSKEGKTYRLPTEAEWEYACRAGTTTRFSFGDDESKFAEYGNTADKSAEGVVRWPKKELVDGFALTAPVGSFKPNGFGLYDMYGNVAELCLGDFDTIIQRTWSPVSDPQGFRNGHTIRGGSWRGRASGTISAARGPGGLEGWYGGGFRVLLVP